jgi:hypothetical protein
MDIASMEPLVPTEDKRSVEDEGFLDAKVCKATWPGPSAVAPKLLPIFPDFCYIFRGGCMHENDRQNAAASAIRALAERHDVEYEQTSTDVLADHITRLSGDDVELDDTELLLIALQRAGHLSRSQAVLMQADYLRQARL